MNNKTNKNLIVIGALAILLAGAHQASAYVPGVWDPQWQSYNGGTMTTVIQSGFDPITQPQTNPANSGMYGNSQQYTNNQMTSRAITTPTMNYTTPVARTSTTTSSSTENRYAPQSATTNTTSGVSNELQMPSAQLMPIVTSDQGASAASAGAYFMPHTFFQWLLVVLLILAIIIISRKIVKHSHEHEVHNVVAAH